MYQQSFGNENQVQFENEHEYYKLLGYLAKSDGTTSLTWEHNEEQGAWGSEGRIHFYTNNRPFADQLRHTAGTGNIISRVNCNEFIQNLVANHHFVCGRIQDVEMIIKTIPDEYLNDFKTGLEL